MGKSVPPTPIIVKKVVIEQHGGHHGGAWKVAYADFVTAMMAFFLLLWLLGATNEKQRKALADYFAPTLVEMKQSSAGSNGMFGGDSITSKDNYPNRANQTGTRSITIPRDATGTADRGGKDMRNAERARLATLRARLEARIKANAETRRLLRNVRFTETREGLRIDLVDEADFSMFALATADLLPQANRLLKEVAGVIAESPNPIFIRGHTDALPYSAGKTMNNWRLSAERAEQARVALSNAGVDSSRFGRIEGVADREPYNPDDRFDPRNRRLSITLGWMSADPAMPDAMPVAPSPDKS